MSSIPVLVLDLVGTFAFAISGATMGVRKRLDLFGVLVLAFAAATAGGIVRDVVIGALPPAALADWRYLAVSLLAGELTFYAHERVERLRNQGNIAPSWATKPPEITDEHWRDLKAGAKLFTLRDAAINVLDDLEGDLGSRTKPAFRLGSELPGPVKSGLDTLRILASEYLKLGHPQPDADLFCKECQSEATRVLGRLVERDGRVLRMAGDEILPSMAYTGRPPAIISQDDDADQPDTATLSLPEGISYRVGNLYLLNLDLNGGLDTWLKRQQGAAQP